MKSALTTKAYEAFGALVGHSGSRFRLGIATRLALTFIAVAVLAVTANLLVEGQVSVMRTTAVVRIPVITRIEAPPIVGRTEQEAHPAPAVTLRPLPNSDPLLRLLERLNALVNPAAETNDAAAGRYERLSAELARQASAYSAGASAAGDPPPASFAQSLQSYRQRGAGLLQLAQTRHELMGTYASHFEQLNARVKEALDRAWKIFGRVVTRQSLVSVSNSLDELRRAYTDFSAQLPAEALTYEALETSEQALSAALVQDRGTSARSDGAGWYALSRTDLDAMSAARIRLQRIDQERAEENRKFLDDANRLTQTITRLERAHAARQRSVQAAAEAAAREASLHKVAEATQGNGPDAAAPAAATVPSSASPLPLAANPDLPSTDEKAAESSSTSQATFDDPGNRHRRSVIAWITACVLLAVVIISAGTVMSIVTPVRRLLRASVQIARGNSAARVPRGGVKELDTLALAFNHMAEQLAIAQDAARDQQTQLEAKVLERTRQLRELAEADPLTRLGNRRHFFTMLNSAIAQARRTGRIVGVLFIDIDNFKNMNDSLGHAFGDQVLQAIARRLEEVTQPFGIAARLGGDEFTVLCNRIATMDDLRAAGARLVAAFHEALACADRDLVISVSVGASVFPEHADDAESLLRAADAALFKAKTLGRNQLALFSPELLEAARVKFTIEQGLRRAMERDEFELAFQPEVNLQNCRVEMVEALLRWRTPDGRIALPGDFLPVAEESGLILQINDWVLRKAIETAARWHHDSWREARVAINVSSRQLFDDTFVERVQALLQQHRLPPECIEIELTENVLQTGQATIDALRRLRALGTAIALDDFGTGFSSLSSLDLLPLTRVKLDRSLVSSIDNSSRSAAIARATIALCQGLGLTITAEGIERPEQLLPLLGYPGLHAQGFLLSQPVNAAAVPQTVHAVSSAVETLIRQLVARTSEAELASALPMLESAARA